MACCVWAGRWFWRCRALADLLSVLLSLHLWTGDVCSLLERMGGDCGVRSCVCVCVCV